jgi:polar amino acid transport system substrate-binding protein
MASRRRLFFFAALAPVLMLSAARAQADSVTLATTDYPPYYGPQLPQGGVIAEIAREAFRRQGYTLRIEWYPWARALKTAQDGSVDGLLGLWRSAERELWLDFSLPLPANQVGFFQRADAPVAFKSMGELKGRRIGIVRGYVNPKSFVDAQLPTEEASDDTTNLRKLAAGRVDLILIDKGVARYLLRSTLPELQSRLMWLEPPIETFALYVGFTKRLPRHERLLAAFNRGLQEIEKDGTLQRLVGAAGI